MKMKRSILFLFAFLMITAVSCSVEDDDKSITDDMTVNDSESVNDDAQTSDSDGSKNDDGTVQDDSIESDSEQTDDVTGDNNTVDDSDTEILAEVSNLHAEYGIDLISLKWTNPSDPAFQRVVIIRNMTKYPEDMTDGDKVFESYEETYSEESVVSGGTYYYRVYACYGEKGCSKGSVIFAKPCFSGIDIVFVMDVSTTMEYMLDALETEIGLVWDYAAEKFSELPRFGLTVFVDDVTVTNGGESFATKELIQAEFKKWADFTSTNKQTQSTKNNGDWPENSLDALALTAQDFKWRDAKNTLRIVVHATDDTFYENPKSFSSGIQVQHTYDQTVSMLVNGEIRVGAFAAKKGGYTGNTDVQPGFFTPYNGKDSIPVATGGEVYFIDDVQTGTIHIYETVSAFIESTACKSYDEK